MFKIIYKNIIKPVLFVFPADDVHILFLKLGSYLGNSSFFRWVTKKILFYENSVLNQNLFGTEFKNPIGLAAGFDYNAKLINILPSVGFGHHSIGTVTYLPYKGNPKPMLGRLPKSNSLLVNKGFKNDGIVEILNRLSNQKREIPLGISIGSTNISYKDTESIIEDIYKSFELAINNSNFDYFELNISCPNLINIESLKDKLDTPLGFGMLLNKLSYLRMNKPLFVKMYSEKNETETLSLCEVASSYNWVTGFIFSNLVKDRTNPHLNKNEISNAGEGNFSGKPTEKITNELISAVYKRYKDRFIIIGCGGVFEGKDAYEKIKRGATLIQLITGMIYEGPSQIGNINKELVKLLKKDGYKNIKEAVGTYHK